MERNPIHWVRDQINRQSIKRLDGAAIADAVDKDLRSQSPSLKTPLEETFEVSSLPLYARISISMTTKIEDVEDFAKKHSSLVGFAVGGILFFGIGHSVGSCHERQRNYPVPSITTQIRRENALPPRSTRPIIEKTPQNSR